MNAGQFPNRRMLGVPRTENMSNYEFLWKMEIDWTLILERDW